MKCEAKKLEQRFELYPKKWTTKSSEYGIKKERVQKNEQIYTRKISPNARKGIENNRFFSLSFRTFLSLLMQKKRKKST